LPADEVKEQIVALIPRLRRFAYALTGSISDGDDVVQTACERALTHLDQWRTGTRLDRWLFRIANNAWIDQVRQRRRSPVGGGTEELERVPGTDGARETEAKLTLAEVIGAMQELPEDQRLVLVMVCVDGMSYQEAAAALEVPIGTVMSRLARARRRIHRRLYGAHPSDAGATEP